MRSDKLFDVMAFVLIAGLGLATAWICFGVLNSQANGRYEAYSLSGSIVGAIVSWGLLTTIFLKVRKSTDELEDLRRKSANELEDLRKKSLGEIEDLRKLNKTLEDKLIRGAPHPDQFDIEVDERQRIVLARPRAWEPKGGVIFQLELPDKEMRPDDDFPASFQCWFISIPKDSLQSREKYYESQIKQVEQSVKQGWMPWYTQELQRLGGEPAAVESLKIIARQASRVHKEIDPDTKIAKRSWELMLWSEFIGWISALNPPQVAVGASATITVLGAGFRDGAVCRINREPKPTKFLNPGALEVTITPEDFTFLGDREVVIENSGANERFSNAMLLKVVEAPLAPPPPPPPPPPAPVAIPLEQDKPEPEIPVEPSVSAENGPKGKKVEMPPQKPPSQEPKDVCVEIGRMTVICHQRELEKIFFFEFWDDSKDFLESSDQFNRILASTRFLG